MAEVGRKISKLSEVDKTAQRLLTKYYPKYVDDQDAIDVATNAILKADWRFNGKGNIQGFRSHVFKNAMKRLLSKKNLDNISKEELDEIASEKYVPNINLDLFDFCKSFLDETQYAIIECYFVYNMNYKEISDKLNIARYSVVYDMNKALDKIFVRINHDGS